MVSKLGNIFGGVRDKILSSQIMEDLVPSLEQYNQRRHLEDLMYDPEWQSATSLGDIEFEQEMYDDIMYGQPYMDQGTARPETQALYENVFGDMAPYDEMAMMGLRKHAMEGGPMRYMDVSPYDVGQFANPWEDESGTYGAYYGATEPWIDINLPLIEQDYERFSTDEYGRYRGTPEGLRNKISDIYRHEYKHGVTDPSHPYSHLAIYGTNAMYGLGRGEAMESDWRFKVGPWSYGESEEFGKARPDRFGRVRDYSPDAAGDYTRDILRGNEVRPPRNVPVPVQRDAPPDRRTHHFNTGGLVSLVL